MDEEYSTMSNSYSFSTSSISDITLDKIPNPIPNPNSIPNSNPEAGMVTRINTRPNTTRPFELYFFLAFIIITFEVGITFASTIIGAKELNDGCEGENGMKIPVFLLTYGIVTVFLYIMIIIMLICACLYNKTLVLLTLLGTILIFILFNTFWLCYGLYVRGKNGKSIRICEDKMESRTFDLIMITREIYLVISFICSIYFNK